MLTGIVNRGNLDKLKRWICFFVTIPNRPDQVTSKNRMSERLAGAILTELLGLDPKDLSGKNFRHAVDYPVLTPLEDTFTAKHGLVSWVDALVPSHHKDLIDLDLSRYHGF